MQCGMFLPPTHERTILLEEVFAAVEEMTEGRVKVKVFPAGALASAPDTPMAIQKGVMDMGFFPFAVFNANFLPLLQMGAMPFTYRDSAGYLNAWQSEDTLINLANKYLAEQGYDKVYVQKPQYSGFYTLGFKDKTPKVPADMDGIKMAARGSVLEVMEMYPSANVYIDNPEVYDALTKGIVDGSPGLPTNWVNSNWMEPINYRLKVNLMAVGSTMGYNKSSFEELSSVDRAILQGALDWIRSAGNSNALRLDVEADAIIAKNVDSTYTPTAEEAKLWSDAGSEYIDEWLEIVGDDGLQALEVIKKYNEQ
jgi:TRAP-type C4-dicarboxylate transport system substrate-binding protein